MRIGRLVLQQIGPFTDETFVFPESPEQDEAEIHLLTGPNGAGKSTALLALIYFFRSHDDMVHRMRSADAKMVVSFDGEDMPIPLSDRNNYVGAQPVNAESIRFAAFAYAGSREFHSGRIQSIAEVGIDPLDNALVLKMGQDADDLFQWISVTKAKAALELMDEDPEAAKRFANPIIKLERVLSEVVGKRIRFTVETKPLHLLIDIDGQRQHPDVLPDGLKSIIGWLGDLIMRLDLIDWEDQTRDIFHQNFILLLDEIAIHLHPAWQRKVLPMVQTLFPNAQIFCSTHSPFVVNSVDNAWIHNIELEGLLARVQEPVLSREARSYATVLSEIFGVKQRFGPDVERELDRFYDLRQRVLGGEPGTG